MTFVLTRLRSFGTGTNAIDCFLLSESNAAFDLVAPNIPAFGRLTGKKLYAGKVSHEPNNALPCFIRLFGMLFDVAEDDLTHTGVNTLRCPFVARMQISAFALVQYPMPVKRSSFLRFCFTHTKSHSLIRKAPHAVSTSSASQRHGNVIQRNRAQSLAASSPTGSALMSSMHIVG